MALLVVFAVAIVGYFVLMLPKAAEAQIEAEKAEERGDDGQAADYRLIKDLFMPGLLFLVLILTMMVPFLTRILEASK